VKSAQSDSSVIQTGYKQTELGLIPKDWQIDTLSAFWKVVDCKHITATFTTDGFPLASIREVQSKYVNLSYANRTTEAFFKKLTEGGRIPEAGDLIISRNATVGEIAQVLESHPPFAMGQDVCIIKKKKSEYSTDFLQSVFKSNIIMSQLSQIMVGSTFKRVNIQQIKSFLIPFPSAAEQTAIAEALSDADALITSLEKLIEKKRAIKQGAMQELLTGASTGSATPSRRLPGFSGAWEVKKLPEICWFQEGPGLRNWQFTSAGMKVINVTNLENGYLNLERTERHISLNEFSKMYKHFEIDSDDIVVASSGNSYGKVAQVRQKDLPLVMNTSVIRFKPINNTDYYFLLTFLKSPIFKDQIDLLITGGAQPNFGPYHLKKIVVSVPKDSAEQTAIASIVRDMDVEIQTLEKKLAKYRQIKQGMMQELLTGRIRLVKN